MNTQTRLHPRCVLLGALVPQTLTNTEAGRPDELTTPGLTRKHSKSSSSEAAQQRIISVLVSTMTQGCARQRPTSSLRRATATPQPQMELESRHLG